MTNLTSIEPIAYIYCDFKDKFGIPRQSNRVKSLTGKIIFTPKYRDKNALNGLENFSHIWLIFGFTKAKQKNWSPTVRPPRLGGNKRIGVFATRSPFRPNSLGLSSVKLDSIETTNEEGIILHVSGIDILDATPIYDIKPYIPYSDCHIDATAGFAEELKNYKLQVDISNELKTKLPRNDLQTIIDCLSDDPRPSYQNNPEKIYSMKYSNFDIKFKVDNQILEVIDIITL